MCLKSMEKSRIIQNYSQFYIKACNIKKAMLLQHDRASSEDIGT